MQSFGAERWFAVVGTTAGQGYPSALRGSASQTWSAKILAGSPVPLSELPGSDRFHPEDGASFGTILFIDWWDDTDGLHVNGELDHGDEDGSPRLISMRRTFTSPSTFRSCRSSSAQAGPGRP